MGKGDQRTRRGKIYRGSFGKSRPKDPGRTKRGAAKSKRLSQHSPEVREGFTRDEINRAGLAFVAFADEPEGSAIVWR